MKLSEIFTDESKWVKFMASGVRNKDGVAHACYWPRATCFCLIGGVEKAVGDYCSPEGSKLREQLLEVVTQRFPKRSYRQGGYFVSEFNDHPDTTFADVQAVIREVESV